MYPVTLLSVCIPVFHAEGTLQRCLDSVWKQNQEFTDWEVLVVNDGSSGWDDCGRKCKKIVKDFRKAHKLSKKQVIYLEHRSNLGLLEARRTLVEAAHSNFILMLDSDDYLLPGALKTLYEAECKSGADIVHAGAESVLELQEKINNVYEGTLNGPEIFNGFLVKNNHVGFLWAKLIRRELYLEALSYIPFTRCVFAEDFLQYFLISYFAKKYVGIKKPVYHYSVESGISSSKKITDLERWVQVCSTANVFTILFEAVKEFPAKGLEPLSQEQMEALRFLSRSYLVNNIKQMRAQIIPELQSQAREILCDCWGEDFVEMMEKALDKPECVKTSSNSWQKFGVVSSNSWQKSALTSSNSWHAIRYKMYRNIKLVEKLVDFYRISYYP